MKVISDTELDLLNDLLEESYQALKGMLTISDYLDGKGYDSEIMAAERVVEKLERILESRVATCTICGALVSAESMMRCSAHLYA